MALNKLNTVQGDSLFKLLSKTMQLFDLLPLKQICLIIQNATYIYVLSHLCAARMRKMWTYKFYCDVTNCYSVSDLVNSSNYLVPFLNLSGRGGNALVPSGWLVLNISLTNGDCLPLVVNSPFSSHSVI